MMSEASAHPLAHWRKSQSPEVSQRKLADELGVTDLTISRWERQETAPQKRHWPLIQQRTGLSRSEFFGAVHQQAVAA